MAILSARADILTWILISSALKADEGNWKTGITHLCIKKRSGVAV